jgi:hypothetical protein
MWGIMDYNRAVNTERLCPECKSRKKCNFEEALDRLAIKYSLTFAENSVTENKKVKRRIINEFITNLEKAVDRDCPKVKEIKFLGFEKSLIEKLGIIFPN